MSLAQKFHKPDLGLLLLRILIGGLMFYHGVQNLVAGVQAWEALGGMMAHFGISVYPSFFGLLCVCVQTFGGLFFLMGLFFRPACLLLTLTMFMAVVFHIINNHGLAQSELALIFTIAFAGFTFMGPGRYSVDK